MSKLDQLKALGDAKRAARTTPSKGLRILTRAKPKPAETVGDGVALTSIAHPPGLIDKIADAIKSGKLSLKRGRGRPKVTGPRPWETEGVSKTTYYRERRRLAEQRSKGESK
jgi:hypothetical protein